MPKYFHFHTEEQHFNAPLQYQRCAFVSATFTCRVRIGRSTIEGANQGLCAGATAGDIVFKKRDKVATYEREREWERERADQSSWAELWEYTAPYGLHLNARENIDAALKRTVGSLTNHTRIDRLTPDWPSMPGIRRDWWRRSVNMVRIVSRRGEFDTVRIIVSTICDRLKFTFRPTEDNRSVSDRQRLDIDSSADGIEGR